MEKLSAGENVAAYCTKCRLVLDHAIVAMDGETILKVKCRTCNSTHKFRSTADVKTSRALKKKEDAEKTAEILWESCLAEAKGRECAYNMTGKFRVGDIIVHDLFGKGVVRKIYFNKVNVIFKDKERLMASAN